VSDSSCFLSLNNRYEPFTKKYKNSKCKAHSYYLNLILGIIHKNSSSIEKYKELHPLDELKVMDARPAQAQASLNMFIPDYLPSRQGKSNNKGFNGRWDCQEYKPLFMAKTFGTQQFLGAPFFL
jgi:hypothetical protein